MISYKNIVGAVVTCCALTLGGCMSSVGHDDESLPRSIDLAAALSDGGGELLLSQLGSRVRYVPLETTDSALVDDRFTMSLTRDYVIVSNTRGNLCMLFDRRDGRFLRTVSSFGQGPEDYSDPSPFADYATGYMYFDRNGRQLLRFSPDGHFDGAVTLPSVEGSLWAVPTDSLVYASVSGAFVVPSQSWLFAIDGKGGGDAATVDSLCLESAAATEVEMQGIAGMTVKFIAPDWHMPGSVVLTEMKDGSKLCNTIGFATIWPAEGNIRYHQPMSDTIYNYNPGRSGEQLSVAYTINTGDRHFDRSATPGGFPDNKEALTVWQVVESKSSIVMVVLQGDEPKGENGDKNTRLVLYDKESATTTVGGTTFTNDIDGFMPFCPLASSPESGVMATLLSAESIAEWLDAHPDFRPEGDLGFLADFDPEGNPVLMIVEK